MMHLPYGRTVAKGKLTRSRLDVRLPIDVLTFKCFTEAGGGDSRVFGGIVSWLEVPRSKLHSVVRG